MTTTFSSSSSRFANFRQKKGSTADQNQGADMKLMLPENEEKPAYEPTTSMNNTRTNMRLLKGRIEKTKSIEIQNDLKSGQVFNDAPKLAINDNQGDLKLVIHDSPQLQQKKVVAQVEPEKKTTQKRILIAKQVPKEEPKQVDEKKEIKPVTNIPKNEETYINPHDEKPIIKQQDIEQSKDQPENENDLVICPEGCGRKFNRKALEKHAKACKLVFMSKRKEFNSQAKRITSKEQASIVRQTKMKQKSQMTKTKTKGFDKTADNWKAQSEDFRNAIKAIKKDDQEGEEEANNEEGILASDVCQFCEKKFAHALLEKHMQNCVKKKEKEEKEKKKNSKKK